MDSNATFRVYNNTHYDIGITLSNNQQRVIRAGTFLPNVTAEDILYIENNARCKPFSSNVFMIKNTHEDVISLEDLGGYTDPYVEKHFSPEEIADNLNKSAKAIANWLKDIDDPVELDAIRDMADKMDLPASKLRVIQAKIPNRNMLEPDYEE